MSNRFKKIIRRTLFAIIPGLLVAGLVMGANMYYDLDQSTNTAVVGEETEITGNLEVGSGSLFVDTSADAVGVNTTDLGDALFKAAGTTTPPRQTEEGYEDEDLISSSENANISGRYSIATLAYCDHPDNQGTSTTLNGDTVYCDNSGNMWAITHDVDDSATEEEWGCEGTSVGADSDTDGEYNTNQILNDGTTCDSRPIAASVCDNLDYAGHSDWYLPAKDPLEALYDESGDCSSWDNNAQSGNYWSSTESDSDHAYYVYFDFGSVPTNYKGNTNYVRCVRGQ